MPSRPYIMHSRPYIMHSRPTVWITQSYTVRFPLTRSVICLGKKFKICKISFVTAWSLVNIKEEIWDILVYSICVQFYISICWKWFMYLYTLYCVGLGRFMQVSVGGCVGLGRSGLVWVGLCRSMYVYVGLCRSM